MAQTTVESIIIDLDNECKAKGMFVNWDMYLAKEKEQIIDFAKQWEERQNDGNLDTIEMLYNEMYNK
jgi:hypothetical protein